jgi:hypothetical protein
VRRLQLEDETGRITAVFWNRKVDELRDVKREDCLQIMDARVKEGLNGRVEIHVESRTQIKILAEKPPQLRRIPTSSGHLTRIAEIKEETEPVNVEGTIETNPAIREVTTSRGEKVMVASFELSDESGKIWVSMWRELANIVKDLNVGTRIRVKKAYAKMGWSNRMELTSRSSTSIEALQ